MILVNWKKLSGLYVQGIFFFKGLWMNQDRFILRVADKFNMINSKFVWRILSSYFKFYYSMYNQCHKKEKKLSLFYDNFMYMIICSRFDIVLAMCKHINIYMLNSSNILKFIIFKISKEYWRLFCFVWWLMRQNHILVEIHWSWL